MKNKFRLLLCATLTLILCVATLIGRAHPADPSVFLCAARHDVMVPFAATASKMSVTLLLDYDNRCSGVFDIYINGGFERLVIGYESDVIMFAGPGDIDTILIDGLGGDYRYEMYSDIDSDTQFGGMAFFDDLEDADWVEVLMFDNN